VNASRRLCLEGEVHVCGVLSLQRAITTALDDGDRQVVVDLGALTLLSAPAMRLFCGTLRGDATFSCSVLEVMSRRGLPHPPPLAVPARPTHV